MKIVKLESNECGGFRPAKGHLDTQMFPECENTPTDRNIVTKTVKNRKKHKKHKACTCSTTCSLEKTAKHKFPLVNSEQGTGLWDSWTNGEISDKTFVDELITKWVYYIVALSPIIDEKTGGKKPDPAVLNGVNLAIKMFLGNRNKAKNQREIDAYYHEAARGIDVALLKGKDTHEGLPPLKLQQKRPPKKAFNLHNHINEKY